uniref:Myb-like domain-containing protein n=1 Tax=Brassica oleracea TaxID=3712 RepID=A0A3P6EFN4_BRAOL|nr:unnamed protein product [Brassica oleracea]
MYADEAESSYNIPEPVQYPTQPEADDGIPRTCYCGGEPVVATSYSRKYPGRRYFTCENVDDGDCHVWKWWDVAVMEEMSDFQTQLRQLKDQGNETKQKSVKLDKTVCELSKKKSGVTNGFELVVCLMEELQRRRTRVSDLASVCKSDTEHSLTMDSNTGFVNLLYSQSPYDLDSPEPASFSSQCHNESGVKERRKWSPKEDKILIGVWLNTSKDPVVSNEQKASTFWKRIQDYYNASPHLVGTTPRELGQCKQRWARINEQVCKFVRCFDAALREQRSGQNDDDVMKAALEIFYNDYSIKFNLEHAWRELRHDKKWCFTFLAKDSVKEKRKQVLEVDGEEEVGEPEGRPVGVKAAKAATKRKKSGKEEDLSKLQGLFEIKQKISKQKLLDRLLAKKETLSEMETSLKLKLMSEMS